MNFLSDKLKLTKKVFAHYWNPNENPTQKDKQALQFLDRAEVELFIQYMNKNPDINLNVVDYNKASLLIKAQDVANNSNHYKKMFSDEVLKQRAIQAVNFLLKKGVDINYRDKNGITALLSACHWGNTEIAQILIQNGADPNLPSNTNNFYTNPLLSAFVKKNIDLVIILLKNRADVEETIELSQRGIGFKLTDGDVKLLRSLGNISTLVRKRRQDEIKKRKNVLTGLSDMIFQDICYSV